MRPSARDDTRGAGRRGFPRRETEDECVARTREHYRARAKQENAVCVAPRPKLRRDADLFVQREILRCPLADLAGRYEIDESEISKRVKEFAELLGAPIDRRRGRPAVRSRSGKADGRTFADTSTNGQREPETHVSSTWNRRQYRDSERRKNGDDLHDVRCVP